MLLAPDIPTVGDLRADARPRRAGAVRARSAARPRRRPRDRRPARLAAAARLRAESADPGCRSSPTCTAAAGRSARSRRSTAWRGRSRPRRAPSWSASAIAWRPSTRSRCRSTRRWRRCAGSPTHAEHARRGRDPARGGRRQRGRQPGRRRRAPPARRGRAARCGCRRSCTRSATSALDTPSAARFAARLRLHRGGDAALLGPLPRRRRRRGSRRLSPARRRSAATCRPRSWRPPRPTCCATKARPTARRCGRRACARRSAAIPARRTASGAGSPAPRRRRAVGEVGAALRAALRSRRRTPRARQQSP